MLSLVHYGYLGRTMDDFYEASTSARIRALKFSVSEYRDLLDEYPERRTTPWELYVYGVGHAGNYETREKAQAAAYRYWKTNGLPR